MKQYMYCAECRAELGDKYFSYLDNYLQVKFFDCPGQSDNAFCSESCAARALTLTELDNVTGEEDDDE